MKDVKIQAKNVGTSIIAEEAHIGSATGSIEQNSAQIEQELVDSILEHTKVLSKQSQSVSNEQLEALAAQLISSMNKLKSEEDGGKKRGIISQTIKDIKITIGVTGDALEAIFKLATLFGIK